MSENHKPTPADEALLKYLDDMPLHENSPPFLLFQSAINKIRNRMSDDGYPPSIDYPSSIDLDVRSRLFLDRLEKIVADGEPSNCSAEDYDKIARHVTDPYVWAVKAFLHICAKRNMKTAVIDMAVRLDGEKRDPHRPEGNARAQFYMLSEIPRAYDIYPDECIRTFVELKVDEALEGIKNAVYSGAPCPTHELATLQYALRYFPVEMTDRRFDLFKEIAEIPGASPEYQGYIQKIALYMERRQSRSLLNCGHAARADGRLIERLAHPERTAGGGACERPFFTPATTGPANEGPRVH